ncbi:glycosyltransferase [Asanoa iriomotensis]|uniref:Glycosyl transferase n=1 Tax=Asanoa iriomotensis TaxID=234613 RepID=A0ABQ4C215_9ACTN|nr:nucleotide disphospho-sugar-binding domain-containing protein [Asanoa iriomotensis]GIF56827.1 glycosyl transferase [Asanoa iriomotensis]
MSSVLLCSSPVHGHVAPLLGVASHLVATGHRVRFLTGARYRDAVAGTGADFLSLPAAADFDDTALDREFPARNDYTGLDRLRYDLREVFLRPMPEQVAAVDAALAAESTDAVLAEMLFFGAAALTQRPRTSRPTVVSLGIVPLSLRSRHTAPFGLGLHPMPGPVGRLRNGLLNVAMEKVVFGSVHRYAQRVHQAATGRRLSGFVLDWPSWTDAVVQFTVPGFEYPRPDRDHHVHFVGPVSRGGFDQPLPSWWGDLSAGRPVVHVTQGTIANQDYSALIRPTIDALADDDVLVVVSTGGRPVETLDGPLPANVRVASYLPYDLLLPLTDVMVTNGGYGGVQFALRHGVPLVVAGTTEDKVEVSARVAWSGVGVNLKTDNPTSAAVGAAVRTVLTHPDYRKSAERIGAEILAAPGLAGLEAVIATPR